VTASNNVSAGNNVTAGQNVTAGANVTANGNVTAGNAVLAQIFYDSNNTAYYVDPNNTSNIASLRSAYINNAGTINSAGRISTGEYLQVGGVAVEGTGCAPSGLVGRTYDGKLLSCQSGLWAANGIQGSYTFMGTYTGSITLNAGSKAQIVMARGGGAASCGDDGTNRFALQGIVGGSQVAYSVDNNNEWSKSTTITFGVPAGSNFTINSAPYACPAGVFSVYVFSL